MRLKDYHRAAHLLETAAALNREDAEVLYLLGVVYYKLGKLELAGYIHIRPDWDDARRKMVAISPAGRKAREAAIDAITPMISDMVSDLGEDKVRATLPVMRELRGRLEEKD